MVSTPSIFRDQGSTDRVAQWLASDASAEERAACSYLFRLVSNSAHEAGNGGKQPGTATRARNLSRPSSASRPASARPPSRHERPSTAAPRMQPSHQGPCLQQSMAHEKYTLRPRTGHSSQAGSPPGGGNESHAAACPPNPWATTNDTFFGFRSQYPEIFNAVEAATRARPAGHLTFLSEYAESMKLGGNNWKQYLKTTTETVNRSVFTPSLAYQVAKDKGFFRWMQKQRLYYGELLTEQAAAELDKALEQAAPEEKVDILLASRVLYALLQPHKHKSTSHLMHCEQKSLTDAYFEELQKSITREKAMGPPKQIVPRDIVPSKVAIAPCTLAVAEGDLKKRAGRSNLMDADTLRSTIPMKMPVRGVNRSTYSEFIGATATRAVKAAKNRPKLCVPIVITCPAGSCDPITTRNQFERFCVPESMAQRSMLPGHHPERNPPETSYRMHYPVRSVKDLERNQSAVARQAEDAALRKNLSTIPIPPGKQGLALKHDGNTEHRRSYKEHRLDCAARSEAGWRAKLACNGPTATVGVTLGGWTQQ